MSATDRKRPNQPWPGADDALAEARAALTAAGLGAELATDHPRALLGPIVAVTVAATPGHVVVTLGRWGCGEPAQWAAGVTAWQPRRLTCGLPVVHASRMPTASAALALTLACALGQPWPTEAERELMAGMLQRLRAEEVV